MSHPLVLYPKNQDTWVNLSIQKIEELINLFLIEKNICNIFLTGGRSAEEFYNKWQGRISNFKGQINFYWGDERYVPLDSDESNYYLAQKSLFQFGVPENCKIFPMNTNYGDPKKSAELYESILPSSIDIVILSMGLDGHIASLFPGSEALLPTDKKVLSIVGPKPPKCRLTITANVLNDAKNIVLFVIGDEKGRTAARALKSGGDIFNYPVCLVTRGLWILDSEAIKHL